MTELTPTPTHDKFPRRFADFETLGEALDYAAEGQRGFNFYDARASLVRVYPFKELQQDAQAAARRLIDFGIKPGDRVALIADTEPQFCALFFGAVYAGALPVPLPLPTSFGGKDSYVDQIGVQIDNCKPSILLYPDEFEDLAAPAGETRKIPSFGWDGFAEREEDAGELPKAKSSDIAYLQYSSGSTRFPHGVAVSHKGILHNAGSHSLGMNVVQGDRCISWLPFYHDMGLVGCFISMVANQVSTDFLKTADFARRPLSWLDLISRNEGSSCSFSPTFGYEICARRIGSQTNVTERFDLSRWRIAGNGADMIRPDVMQRFTDAFAPAGFDAKSFLPSYGLAEATLAVTIMPPGEGMEVELVQETELSGEKQADGSRPKRYRAIVNCGKPVRDTLLEIREEDGSLLGEKTVGKVWMNSPSLMDCYYGDPDATEACLIKGWLDTGDMGYLSDGYLYIVGRAKDMIIINGKNHWPQDIEWAVEQLPGFKAGDIAAFAITTPGGEETPAVLVQCRTSDETERARLRDEIREKVRAITGMSCVIELVPPRTLPRTSSGKLSRAKAKNLYLSGDIQPYAIAA